MHVIYEAQNRGVGELGRIKISSRSTSRVQIPTTTNSRDGGTDCAQARTKVLEVHIKIPSDFLFLCFLYTYEVSGTDLLLENLLVHIHSFQYGLQIHLYPKGIARQSRRKIYDRGHNVAT